MQRKRIKILDALVDVLTMGSAINRIESWINEKKKKYVCVAPVSTIVDAIDNEKYRQVVNNADMVIPDGMPIVWIAKAKGQKEIGRVYGPDMMKRICVDPCLAHWRHFFFGATSETLELLRKRLKIVNPDIKICGSYAPPFRDRAVKEDDSIIQMINDAQPDIVWVGIGAPKQDYWMVLNRDQLNVPVIIGIGAAFDFLAGLKPMAPEWVQQIGMEWFFRLCCEPRRLWRRYVIGNSKFLFELLKELIGVRRGEIE